MGSGDMALNFGTANALRCRAWGLLTVFAFVASAAMRVAMLSPVS